MKVTTINGKVVDKKLTRKIRGKYYLIGDINKKDSGDCFKINNRYRTLEKKTIEWDHYLKKYSLKSNLIYGIIEDGEGYFSHHKDVINIYQKKSLPAISKVILSKGEYFEHEGIYYSTIYHTYKSVIPRITVGREHKNHLSYGFEDYQGAIADNFNFKSIKNSNVEALYNTYLTLFEKYSFGVELETERGVINNKKCFNLGMAPVRDGSINGLEYVTKPLTGKEGFYNFITIVNEIIKNTDSNSKCSMHVHVGGLDRTEDKVLSMFKLGGLVQKSVYSLFPKYKNSGKSSSKHYTKPLRKFTPSYMKSLGLNNDVFNKLLNMFTGDYYTSHGHKNLTINDITHHPNDVDNNRKWNLSERYKWLNIIPIIFTNKKTVEYRVFTMPDTIEKAIFFLLSSLMITDFADTQSKIINSTNSNISVTDIIEILGYKDTFVSDMLKHRLYHIDENFKDEPEIPKLSNERYI